MAKVAKRDSGRKGSVGAAEFLRRLFPAGAPIFLASYGNDRDTRAVNKVVADPADVSKFIEKHDTPGRACYFGVNVMNGGVRSKDTLAKITSLFVDLDFKGITETPEAIKAAIANLKLKPTAVVMSGHGYHCYWKLDKPLSREQAPSTEGIMRRICAKLAGDTSAAEVSRVLRLPGSHNSKNDEWIEVAVVGELSSWKSYGVAEIDQYFSELDPQLTYRQTKRDMAASNDNNPYKAIAREMRKLTSNFDADELLDKMVFHDVQGNGIDDTLTRVVGAMVAAGNDVNECITVFLPEMRRVYQRDREAGEPAWDERRAIRDIRVKFRYFRRKDRDKPEKATKATKKKRTDTVSRSFFDEPTGERPAKKKSKFDEINKPLPFIDMSGWDDEEVPERQWAVPDLMPMANPFLLSGEGAAGKSLLSLQLGVAHALGKDWIGTTPRPGPFLYFGAEDDKDELHRRMHDILNYYGATFADIQDKVHLLSYAGEDAVLAVTEGGIVEPTMLFERLFKAAEQIQPVNITLDTAADIFAGNEINRSEVRQFIGLLRKLAMRSGAAVNILAHPSLSGISSGSGLSGSTGWHNSVRARAYFSTLKADKDDDEPDSTLRLLEFKKNNYGPVAESVTVQWVDGVYRVVSNGAAAFVDAGRNKANDEIFMTLLKRLNQQQRYVSEKPSAKNYAPNLFYREEMAKREGVSKGNFESALRRLFDADKLEVEAFGPPSKRTTRLIPKVSK